SGFVLANRDPGSSQPRITQSDAAEDRDQQQYERGPEHQGDEVDVRPLLAEVAGREPDVARQPVAEAGRIDGIDPRRARGEVEAEPVPVTVDRDHMHDFAESER